MTNFDIIMTYTIGKNSTFLKAYFYFTGYYDHDLTILAKTHVGAFIS